MSVETLRRIEEIKAEIRKISQNMEPQPDKEGNLIPSFEQWIFSLQLQKNLIDLLLQNESILKILKNVYHFAIYNRPKPLKEPIQEYLSALATKLSNITRQREDFEKSNMSDLTQVSAGTFTRSDGQLYSIELFDRMEVQLNQEKKLLTEILL